MVSTLNPSDTPRPPPATAYELTITVTVTDERRPSLSISHTGPREVLARALPSLPLRSALDRVRWPSYRLEVIDLTPTSHPKGEVLYRRPFVRPGYVEAYGPDSGWTLLPKGHGQVLCVLLPMFLNQAQQKRRNLYVVAYEPNEPNEPTPWFRIQLQ